MATLKELRSEAKQQYNRGKGNEKLKGYGRMSKAALMAKLGKSNEDKRDNRAIASTKTANAIASKLADEAGGDHAVKRVQAKARLLRSVKREIDAARKANPDISQEELRKVAGKAFLTEAKAIKEGKAEVKPIRKKSSVKSADEKFIDSVVKSFENNQRTIEGSFKDTWNQLKRLEESGKAKRIGVGLNYKIGDYTVKEQDETWRISKALPKKEIFKKTPAMVNALKEW